MWLNTEILSCANFFLSVYKQFSLVSNLTVYMDVAAAQISNASVKINLSGTFIFLHRDEHHWIMRDGHGLYFILTQLGVKNEYHLCDIHTTYFM